MTTTALRVDERNKLHHRYRSKIQTNPRLDRTIVSFQANRKARFFNWFKYKEGFSAELARDMIDKYTPSNGLVLDPFAGIGTTSFVARAMGRQSIAIELLPVGAFAVEARIAADSANRALFTRHVGATADIHWPDLYDPAFAMPHIPITQGAFSRHTERALAGFRAYCRHRIRNAAVRQLFHLAGLAVLESVSFTRKDGQYLRWDSRAPRERKYGNFDKGRIPDFGTAIHAKLDEIRRHISEPAIPENLFSPSTLNGTARGAIELRRSSCLDVLPSLPDESIDLVLTSPPYCNRYDYTRTYALELVYLGLGEEEVKALRQAMLSCTVENRDKVAQMEAAYSRLGQNASFNRVCKVFDGQSALHEVLGILDDEARSGRLNNANIPRMVRNYFFEMCFVVFELSRSLRSGGRVVMVNDNVRYAGEEVPVDLVLSDFARRFGLQIEHIWTLARGKGNSSQQMGAHGRTELRKCVYVWRKP